MMQEKCLDCKWCRIGAGTGQGAFPLECKNSKVENKESCFEADKEGECMKRLTRKKLGNTDGKKFALCNHREDDCNDSCQYGTCEWSRKALLKLKSYEDLEEQGFLINIPCSRWLDIVFGEQEVFWGIDKDYIENQIREITVDNSERFTWYDGWKTVVLKGADENGFDWEFLPEEIGKNVFLTKGEAEEALQKMKEATE